MHDPEVTPSSDVLEIALVPLGVESTSADDISRVAEALDGQLRRDFTPPWGISARVNAYSGPAKVPDSAWQIVLMDAPPINSLGIHLDHDRRPYALVQASPGIGWSLVASHECLEMLVNPLGDNIVRGPCPQPPHHDVYFLKEVCDPVASARCSYRWRGVTLSDFCLPSFFDHAAPHGQRCSFAGSATRPFSACKGGVLTWYDPSRNDWWALRESNGESGEATIESLGPMAAKTERLRHQIEFRDDSVQGRPLDIERFRYPAGQKGNI